MGSIDRPDMVAMKTADYLSTDSTPLAVHCGWQRKDATGYEILERPYGQKRPFKVIHIGAGASGIIFAKFARDSIPDVELQIYDKNDEVGGTWLENRYPGCACDIPSACYQFTWNPNPNWSQYYSQSKEIWQYMYDTVEKFGLRDCMKFSHTVTGAYWNDEEGLWHVKVTGPNGNEFEDTCNLLFNGSGILNNWKWPDIEGLHEFKGTLLHSAHVDESTNFDGKKVAVVGIGSSGIQIVSTLSKKVQHLYTWVRSPTWITAGFAQRFAGIDGGNYAYTEEQKESFRKNPGKMLKYIKMIESELNQRFKFILNGSLEAQQAKDFAINEMTRKLGGDKDLCEAIIPKDFGVGCRRPTPGSGFLEALTQDNVKVFTKPMKRVTNCGFLDSDDVEHEVDIILCATGFDTTWVPRFPIIANNINVQDHYKNSSDSYFGVAVPQIPNYYTAGGPYGSLGHGSALPILEQMVRLVCQVIDKMRTDNIKSVAPKADVCADFAQHAQLYLKRTAWSGSCSSWFKQGRVDGPLTMFPGSRLLYFDILATPRFEDYEVMYYSKLNRFEFLGNGFSMREFDGRDITYYWGLLDGKDEQRDLEAEVVAEGLI